MSFWDRNMPIGMFLRSNWTATQIADPNTELTLEAYQAASGSRFSIPVPLEEFVNYGRCYQSRAVPDLDRLNVIKVEKYPKGFSVILADGEEVLSRRVVIATGISTFARWAAEFQDLPRELVSHCSEHRDLGKFAGKSVLIVGNGQSALESAALLHENGAEVEVVSPASQNHCLAACREHLTNTRWKL
jgi:thioredoxin reductase